MARLSVAVMAHHKRDGLVADLVGRLGVGPEMVTWDEREDRWDTGRRAMEARDPSASHHLVLQDDAAVCRDLPAGLEKALDHVPEQAIVSCYVGTRRPLARKVQHAVELAEQAQAAWIVLGPLNWGVAICVPTGIIPEMLAWCDGQTYPNYDRRIGRFFRQKHIGWPTWHTWPTLVDHRDVPSLIGHGGDRRSHRFLGEDSSALDMDWSGPVVDIPALSQTSPKVRALWTKGGALVKFVSDRYPNLDLSNRPGLHGVRFVDGRCEVSRPQAVSILQSPWWQRRGVRLATADDEQQVALPAVASGEPDGPPVVATAGQPPAEPVPDGTTAEVLAWVGTDTARARQALATEQLRDKPRSSLVTKLEKIGAGNG